MQPRDLSGHDTYEAGRGVEEVARELGREPEEFLKLASNENPHGPSPRAVDAIEAHADGVNAYPTAAHADLRAAVADRWAVSTDQVWLSAGADGAIDYLCRALLDPDDGVLVPDPGFAYYPMSARFHHGQVRTYGFDAGFQQSAESVLDAYDGERIVFLTSPHNPTGTALSLAGIERVADETGENTLVVVDEAYGEYAARPSAVSLLGGRDRIVEGLHEPPGESDASGTRDDVAVLRTFSKAYGLAGLRVGYAVVPDAWADAYARVNTPFAVNELACRAGLEALEDDDHVRRSVASAVAAREAIAEGVDAPTVDSEANFVLVEVGDDDAPAVAEATKRRGVIVRDCSSFGLPGHVRISCGTESETERGIEALNAAIAEVDG